jgi:hypothetical protein
VVLSTGKRKEKGQSPETNRNLGLEKLGLEYYQKNVVRKIIGEKYFLEVQVCLRYFMS